MPIYEYRCEGCGELTETLRRMADADAPQACEHCGGDRTARVHSVFAAGATSSASQAPIADCGKPGGCGGGMCGI